MNSKKNLFILAAFLLLPAVLFCGGQEEEKSVEGFGDIETWEKHAQLGKYRPADDDWQAIEEAAKKEGTVVVYANSSRVFEYCRTFYNKYGIKAIPNDMDTNDLLSKLGREQDAGVYNPDVIQVGDIATFYNDFLYLGKVYSFIPSNFKSRIYEISKQEPLAIHHYGAKVVFYNTEKYGESPIDSWWDLTREEWHGKLVLKDPLKSATELNFFATSVKYADEMEKSYREEFGEDIVLHGTENAGYEFIKRLMENGMVMFGAGGDVAKAVGSRGQEDPPLGITSYSKLRTAADSNLHMAPALNLKPVGGFHSKVVIAIPKFAPNPNAAKLMVRWMMGAEGEDMVAGYKPYHVLGDWSSRTDIPEPKGQKPIEETGFWMEEGDWLYGNAVKIRDFWIQHM